MHPLILIILSPEVVCVIIKFYFYVHIHVSSCIIWKIPGIDDRVSSVKYCILLFAAKYVFLSVLFLLLSKFAFF